jgi:16S rRNA (guanine966-N2)-methyltransferase
MDKTGKNLRPTSERAREAVFNILEHGIDWPGIKNASVIDVFAGTGAYGLEALSRGAAHATFIDEDAGALELIRKNASTLGEEGRITPLRLDAAHLAPPPQMAATAAAPCRLAFCDPPYNSNLSGPALLELANKGWIGAGGVCVVEMAAKENFDPPADFDLLDERTYGAAKVIFLKKYG